MSNSMIKLNCNNVNCTALIDSGAGTSCMSQKVMHRLNAWLEPITPGKPMRVCAADGRPLLVKGSTLVDIELGGNIVTCSFLVLKDLPQGIILGTDFLRANNALVDFENQVVKFQNSDVQVNMLHGKKDQSILAYVKNDTILDANSETI